MIDDFTSHSDTPPLWTDTNWLIIGKKLATNLFSCSALSSLLGETHLFISSHPSENCVAVACEVFLNIGPPECPIRGRKLLWQCPYKVSDLKLGIPTQATRIHPTWLVGHEQESFPL